MRSIRRRAGWSTVAKKSGSETATRSTGICRRANQTRTVAGIASSIRMLWNSSATISIVARSTGVVAACLSACLRWCSSSSSAGVLTARRRRRRRRCGARRGAARRSPAPRRSPRSGAATAAPARARCRRSRAAAGRPGGSAGRAPPRPGRCRAPGRRRASSAASPRRPRWPRPRPRVADGWNSVRAGACRSACRSRRRDAAIGRGPPWLRAADERPQVDLRQHVALRAGSGWSRGTPLRRSSDSSSCSTDCSSRQASKPSGAPSHDAGDDARQHVRRAGCRWRRAPRGFSSTFMRERRSVNSHEARSIIASASRELRISCSIVSSSTRLSLPPRAAAAATRQLAERASARPCRWRARRAAASSCRAARSASGLAASAAARGASSATAGSATAAASSSRALVDRLHHAPGMPPSSRSAYDRLACCANAVGLAGVGMGSVVCSAGPEKVAFDSTPPPRRSDRSDRAPWPRRLDQVFALDAEPHRDRRGDEHRRVDAEQDADRQRDGEVVQRRAAEEQHRQHHHLRSSRG